MNYNYPTLADKSPDTDMERNEQVQINVKRYVHNTMAQSTNNKNKKTRKMHQ